MFKVTSRWPHQGSIKVEWNLGKRCNYDCSYCPASIHDNSSPHTDIEILKATVDKLMTLGKPIRLSFTGGEPAVHPKIEKLLSYAKEKNISWINLTTNGTRQSQWYLDMEKYINHYVFSLHFEYDWDKVLDNIIHFSNWTNKPFFINVMAHHNHMENVRTAVDFLEHTNIKFAIRRIRWIEDSHNVFDDLKYNGNDLDWILKKEASAEANVLYNDQQMHANDVIKLHLNNFKQWNCYAGIESLMINWDGDVHRATCRVGGSLGNIYHGTFTVPDSSISCTRDWCTCAADIPITKFST
jgi:MoaA/NifB/PqqE/SkfB family radical SAM enzyme